MQPSNGIIIAGVHSSSGKTAVTCMVLAALAERKLPVQPFKAGPDFIDPGYHNRFAGGAVSRNLDRWLMGEKNVAREAALHTTGCLGVLEGVMGLFDGSDSQSDEGSTMELARQLDWPVVLVLPSGKAGRSLAATLRGFIAEAGPGRIAGVILNQVNGSSHADYLREAIAPLGLPVFGSIPPCDELHWPERHLGLQASQERELPSRSELAQLAEKHLDIAGLLALLSPVSEKVPARFFPESHLRIGIARDQAFHFYYEANLDYLRDAGTELIEFSPLQDSTLPHDLDGLLFGGGFPEVFADQLAQNQSLRAEVHDQIESGLPCYAECGGLMYLAQELITRNGKSFPMAGVIPGAVEMTSKLHHFGYCLAARNDDAESAVFHGHEFHHSIWRAEKERANLWNVRRKRAGSERREGCRLHNLHASYVHLHFASSGAVAQSLFNLQAKPEVARI